MPNDTTALPLHPLDRVRDRFREVIETLTQIGWTRLRADTLVPPGHDPADREAWTVRHHYDAGVFEIHYEPDQYWHRGQAPNPEARLARIRRDRSIPEVEEILLHLFGTTVPGLAIPVEANTTYEMVLAQNGRKTKKEKL